MRNLVSLAFWSTILATATGAVALFLLIQRDRRDHLFVAVLAVLAVAELIPLIVHLAKKYR